MRTTTKIRALHGWPSPSITSSKISPNKHKRSLMYQAVTIFWASTGKTSTPSAIIPLYSWRKMKAIKLKIDSYNFKNETNSTTNIALSPHNTINNTGLHAKSQTQWAAKSSQIKTLIRQKTKFYLHRSLSRPVSIFCTTAAWCISTWQWCRWWRSTSHWANRTVKMCSYVGWQLWSRQ